MKRFARTFAPASTAAAITLLFAAAPVAAQDGRVRVGDLNLSTRSGAADLDARINGLAHSMCRGARTASSLIPDKPVCHDAVRREVMRQLPAASRQAYARARASV